MMSHYFVKAALPGVPAGRVERFSVQRAATWEAEGLIEPYDPKRHATAPGAPVAAASSKSTSSK